MQYIFLIIHYLLNIIDNLCELIFVIKTDHEFYRIKTIVRKRLAVTLQENNIEWIESHYGCGNCNFFAVRKKKSFRMHQFYKLNDKQHTEYTLTIANTTLMSNVIYFKFMSCKDCRNYV